MVSDILRIEELRHTSDQIESMVSLSSMMVRYSLAESWENGSKI